MTRPQAPASPKASTFRLTSRWRVRGRTVMDFVIVALMAAAVVLSLLTIVDCVLSAE